LRVVDFRLPLLALVDRLADFRAVVDRLLEELLDFVDLEAVERDVVFLAPLFALVDLDAPLFAFVDLEAPLFVFVDLAAPPLAFVDLEAPLFAFVDLEAPLLAFVDLEAPFFAFVDLAVPLLAFVDLVELFDLLREVDALPFDVDLAAISFGSCGYSGGYRSANSCFTPAPEKVKQPAVDSVHFCVSANDKGTFT